MKWSWISTLAAGLFFLSNARAAEDPLDIPLSIPLWSPSVNVRGSFGYKDNLALGNTNIEKSPFFHGDIEFFLFRMPTNGTEVTFFLEAEDYRYFEGHQVDHETYVISQGDFRHRFASPWTLGISADYVYQDLVTDFSTLETNAVLQVRGHGFGLRPMVRRELGKTFWAELRLSGVKQYYAEPLGDYWEPGPRLTLGWKPGPRTLLQFSHEFLDRIYDDRQVVDLSLSVVPGTTRRLYQHNFDLRLDHSWDRDSKWRTSTRLLYGFLEDNGPGFFNYSLFRAGQSLEYREKKWRARAAGRFSYYRFDNQTVSSTDLSVRDRLTATFTLRGEREILHNLKVFAEYEHERALSNRSIEEYAVNTIAGGLDWEF